MLKTPSHFRLYRTGLLVVLACVAHRMTAQLPDNATVVRGVDTSVDSRDDGVLGYTVTEHYAVFRNHDEEHPAAEMKVKTTYHKEAGKSYEILERNGSELLQKEVLDRFLDNEKLLTQPANRSTAVITSKNYQMHVIGSAVVNGQNCLTVALEPRHASPFLFKGTIWVDAQSYAIVQLEGVAAKSPSVLIGAPQVYRQYEEIDGFPMATHAKAVSNSWLVGQTTVKIDYSDYHIELRPSDSHLVEPNAQIAPAGHAP